jgi:secreted Zn-dependent insulinase-like peptidase
MVKLDKKLKEITNKEFINIVKSIIILLGKKISSIRIKSQDYFEKIILYDGDFEVDKKRIENIKQLKSKDLYKFYKAYIKNKKIFGIKSNKNT